MQELDTEQNENYEFLECEQAEQIDTDAVYEKVKAEMDKIMKTLTSTELYERNPIEAINTTAVPVASYVINFCDFNQKQIDDLNKLIKKALRDKGTHDRQASDERLYLKVEHRGRWLKGMKYVPEDTMMKVACYITHQSSPWIEAAWESEAAKDGKSVCQDLNDTLDK